MRERVVENLLMEKILWIPIIYSMYCGITNEFDEETTLIFSCMKSSDFLVHYMKLKWLSLKIHINMKK